MLSKYNPSEVVISKSDVFNTEEWYLRLHPHVTSIEDWTFNYDNSYRDLIDHFKVKSLKGFGCENFPIGIISAGGLFTYLKNNLSMSVSHLKKISPIQNIGIMGLGVLGLDAAKKLNELGFKVSGYYVLSNT